jgi:hypothetical protein
MSPFLEIVKWRVAPKFDAIISVLNPAGTLISSAAMGTKACLGFLKVINAVVLATTSPNKRAINPDFFMRE